MSVAAIRVVRGSALPLLLPTVKTDIATMSVAAMRVVRGSASSLLPTVKTDIETLRLFTSRSHVSPVSHNRPRATSVLSTPSALSQHAVSFLQSGTASACSWSRVLNSETPLFARPPFVSTGGSTRHFRVVSPLMMGRRSSKIAMRKGVQDAKKSKLYGKIGKQIVSAVKMGGGSAVSNPLLALLLSQAKLYDIPKDIIERNIKRALDKGQADYAEAIYEVYGVGGVGIVLDVLTENSARAAAHVRDVVKKGGGKMADPGSVLFNFNRCGVVAIPVQHVSNLDDLLMAAMDAGADDVAEPQPHNPEEEDPTPPVYRVITALESYITVQSKLEEAGVKIDRESSGLQLLPLALVEPDDEAREVNELMMEKLLELDDVDAVYSNQN